MILGYFSDKDPGLKKHRKYAVFSKFRLTDPGLDPNPVSNFSM